MDIKLKNSRNTRIKVAIAGILLISLVGLFCFPAINQKAKPALEQVGEERGEEQIDSALLEDIYEGCYKLYLETVQREISSVENESAVGVENKTAADVFLEFYSSPDADDEQELTDFVNQVMEEIGRNFEECRSEIDYCILLGKQSYEKNTNQPLERALTTTAVKDDALSEYYSTYFVLKFDAGGMLSVDKVYSRWSNEDSIIKTMGQIDRENPVWGDAEETYSGIGGEFDLRKPSDFTVVFGIPKTAQLQVWGGYGVYYGFDSEIDYYDLLPIYAEAGGTILFVLMLAISGALVWFMTSKKIWKTEISMNRPGHCYLAEAAVVGAFTMLCLHDSFLQMIWQYDSLRSYEVLRSMFTGGKALAALEDLLSVELGLLMLVGIWYLSLYFLRPMFSLGLREYIRQYSFLYQIFPWLREKWEKFVAEVRHIDFSEKSVKTIIKIVVINFLVLAVISCFWFVGIWFLLGYSIVVFYLLKKNYDRIGRDYQMLLYGVNRIAEGDLETEITEDIGVFEPFKAELGKIRSGFKKAVEDEVKSQRMKTELITNVSHDLKTPLTAITTYVELLKKEDITEEERRSYIETLEKKSLRLKVLIEDLFEVSKATSNNISLNLMEVDVVNLMKQVSVEHADKFEQMGLELRWNVPKEKVILMLDNQKTYRIFENLFVNIQKYAMPQSRVYVDVKKTTAEAGTGKLTESSVDITIKNMSANELNFNPDEITERFVRGDVSRNTEGSGLGLAIAKSFTEAQGGKFHVEVDGDLFKVVIQWK